MKTRKFSNTKEIFNFRIANINLLIETDILINGLTYKKFDPFRIKNITPNIVFKYLMIVELKEIPQKKNQYIERTLVSTSIFDFQKNYLHTYYLSKFKSELEQFRLGPFLLAPFLSSFSAAMIHCSAILRKGKVAIFLAPDEGGKTTVVKLAQKGQILCDDQNIIKKEDGRYHVYGTPWGMIANNFNGPIGAFFIIEKADKFKLTTTHSDILLSYLWNEHLPYLFFLPKKYSQRHFNFLFELSRSIPAYRLQFSPKFIDWDAIEKTMNNR